MQTVRIAWRGCNLLVHLLFGILLTPLVTRRDKDGYWHVHHGTAAWWHARVARILRLQITTSGAPPEPPTLVVANHISWLDIIVLGHLMPTCFLSKSEVRQWPLIGWLAMRAGTFFIRRGGGEANDISQTIGRHLLHEGILTLFPEGTTTNGRVVRPFFSRLLAAAIETHTPLTPVAIRYHCEGKLDDRIAPYIDEQSLGKNLLGLLSRPGGAVHVHFASPIEAEGMERKKLAQQARTAIIEALAQTGIE